MRELRNKLFDGTSRSITYPDLVELAKANMDTLGERPDSSTVFYDLRSIDHMGVIQFAAEFAGMRPRGHTAEEFAAMFCNGFELGVLVGEQRRPA